MSRFFSRRSLSSDRNIDAAVQGKARSASACCVDALAAGKDFSAVPGLITRDFVNPPAAYIEDLDTLPLPARHLLPNDTYTYLLSRGRVTTVFSSRGCPYQCIFLRQGGFGSRWRHARRELLAELEQVVREFRRHLSASFYDNSSRSERKGN